MSITFDVPEDIQRQAEGIIGLNRRVTDFLRHEIEMEKIRRRRYSPRAREIVERALTEVERDKEEGFDRETSFKELIELHRKITEQLP